MTYTAEELAERLLREKRSGRSWRKIAREDYGDRINFATLNRIALSRGEYLPKNRRQLILLGLVEPRKRTPVEKAISRMARETNDAVVRRKK